MFQRNPKTALDRGIRVRRGYYCIVFVSQVLQPVHSKLNAMTTTRIVIQNSNFKTWAYILFHVDEKDMAHNYTR